MDKKPLPEVGKLKAFVALQALEELAAKGEGPALRLWKLWAGESNHV